MSIEELRSCFAEICSCNEEDVQPETSIKEDLGMDSLDAMELVMLIEEKTGIAIPEEKLPEFVKVQDILAFLNEQAEG